MVRPKTRKKDMFATKGMSLKNSSLTLKAYVFEQKMMTFTFDEWVQNVIPVQNPTQYTKLGKHKVKNDKSQLVQYTKNAKNVVFFVGCRGSGGGRRSWRLDCFFVLADFVFENVLSKIVLEIVCVCVCVC